MVSSKNEIPTRTPPRAHSRPISRNISLTNVLQSIDSVIHPDLGHQRWSQINDGSVLDGNLIHPITNSGSRTRQTTTTIDDCEMLMPAPLPPTLSVTNRFVDELVPERSTSRRATPALGSDHEKVTFKQVLQERYACPTSSSSPSSSSQAPAGSAIISPPYIEHGRRPPNSSISPPTEDTSSSLLAQHGVHIHQQHETPNRLNLQKAFHKRQTTQQPTTHCHTHFPFWTHKSYKYDECGQCGVRMSPAERVDERRRREEKARQAIRSSSRTEDDERLEPMFWIVVKSVLGVEAVGLFVLAAFGIRALILDKDVTCDLKPYVLLCVEVAFVFLQALLDLRLVLNLPSESLWTYEIHSGARRSLPCLIMKIITNFVQCLVIVVGLAFSKTTSSECSAAMPNVSDTVFWTCFAQAIVFVLSGFCGWVLVLALFRGEVPDERPFDIRSVNRLERVRYSKDGCEDEDCSICLNSMEVGTKLPCGHVFHHTCVEEWLSVNQYW
ncbi:hypothetical protein SmJEL517_g03577 [Synchytrium microbalum]|uniref:RING-type domain-containing protein n=1 Tax=Synchytrium microbalum TaxID=1806994 RepID=A0A507C1P0_9FUNG|nr:uncharacterized protein SmJEL517_g03577 [Synchytrium microbalum]TPX33622.1 hypothetical protein SmJEL517_g03577 [Synchytrium microbalum]